MAPFDSPAYQRALIGAVDPDAPARAYGSIDIDAPREVVWDAVAHVENWPSIRGDITDAVAPGSPAAGATFVWRAGGVPITSAFARVERPTLLTWANTAPGLAMTCVYEFEEPTPGRTRIWGEESMDAAAVAPHIDDAALAASIRSWLEGIRRFVEVDRAA